MARITKSALNLRELLAKLSSLKSAPRRHTFDYEFDGTETSKTLPAGWKPYAVYMNGEREREGTGNDYTLSFDGFAWSVNWPIAPNNTSYTQIDAEGVPHASD